MTRTLRSLSPLVALFAVGCQQDPSDSKVELSLEASPDQIEAVIGSEGDTPSVLSVVHSGAGQAELTLSNVSADPTVATVFRLIGPSFGATLGPSCAKGETCAGQVASGSEIDLYVACHRVGATTIEMTGTIEVQDSQAGVTAVDQAKDSVTIGVTCVAETSMNDPKLDTLLGLGDQLFGDGGSALLEATDLQLSEAPTPHSSNEVAPAEGRGDHMEWHAHVAAQVVLDIVSANAEFLSCGPQPNGFTFCPGGMGPMPEGPYLIIGGVLHEAPPDFPSDTEVTYGIVMDSDGDPANDFVADPAYPNDFYQGTDRWTELTGNPGGWTMTSTLVNGGVPTPISDSQARMVMIDNVLLLIIAASEIPVVTPLHRLTAFEHAGDWGFESPWAGDLHPQVSEGLASFP